MLKHAVITNPGALSRRDEIIGIKDILQEFLINIEKIESPGILDGGLSCLSIRF